MVYSIDMNKIINWELQCCLCKSEGTSRCSGCEQLVCESHIHSIIGEERLCRNCEENES
jgi:hypothetical protein